MKNLIGIILTLLSLTSFGQDSYGFKKITINPDDDCIEKLKECSDNLCWLTWKYSDGTYTQGIALGYGGCHNVWLKEVRKYNSQNEVLESFIDSTVYLNFLIKSPIQKIKKYFNDNDKYIINNYKVKYIQDRSKEPYFIYVDSMIVK